MHEEYGHQILISQIEVIVITTGKKSWQHVVVLLLMNTSKEEAASAHVAIQAFTLTSVEPPTENHHCRNPVHQGPRGIDPFVVGPHQPSTANKSGTGLGSASMVTLPRHRHAYDQPA